MPIPESNKKAKKVIVEYDVEDYRAIESYKLFLRHHIEIRQAIPSRAIKKLLDLLDSPKSKREKEVREILEKAQAIAKNAIISGRHNFEFKKRVKSLEEGEFEPPTEEEVPKNENRKIIYKTHVYTGTNFMWLFFFRLMLKSDKSTYALINDKNALARYAIEALIRYLPDKVTLKDKYPSNNSIYIIAGYILMAFGHVIPKEQYENSKGKHKKYYPEYLSYQAKNASKNML